MVDVQAKQEENPSNAPVAELLIFERVHYNASNRLFKTNRSPIVAASVISDPQFLLIFAVSDLLVQIVELFLTCFLMKTATASRN